jgi:hypothetical protein
MFGIGPLELIFGLLGLGLLVAATVLKSQPRKVGFCYLAIVVLLLLYALIQGMWLFILGG